jgi:hypothetical protein
MTRRENKEKVIDKSAEKQKRDELIASIATETTVKQSLQKDSVELKKIIKEENELAVVAKDKKTFWEKASDDAERLFKDLETKIRPLHSELGTLEVTIVQIKKEEAAAKEALLKMQIEATEEMARLNNFYATEKNRIDANFISLARENTELENRVTVLKATESSLVDSIAENRREQIAVTSSLELRIKELAQINLNLSSTQLEISRAQKEVGQIDTRLAVLKVELTAKDKEIQDRAIEVQEKEDEVTLRKQELLALALKEKRIEELVPAIQELYRSAGLSVKI